MECRELSCGGVKGRHAKTRKSHYLARKHENTTWHKSATKGTGELRDACKLTNRSDKTTKTKHTHTHAYRFERIISTL